MADWHRLGSKDELFAGAPFSIKIERHRIAVFLYSGRLTAISDICNHKGYVQLPPIAPRKLLKHKPSHLLEEHAIARARELHADTPTGSPDDVISLLPRRVGGRTKNPSRTLRSAANERKYEATGAQKTRVAHGTPHNGSVGVLHFGHESGEDALVGVLFGPAVELLVGSGRVLHEVEGANAPGGRFGIGPTFRTEY